MKVRGSIKKGKLDLHPGDEVFWQGEDWTYICTYADGSQTYQILIRDGILERCDSLDSLFKIEAEKRLQDACVGRLVEL